MKQRRLHSEAFINRTINRIDEMFETTQQNPIMTPRLLMPDSAYSVFGTPRISEREREEISDYYNQFRKLAYVNGFWYGWSLRDGTKDERDDYIKLLEDVARSAYNVPEFDHIFDNYPKQFSKSLRKKLEKLKETGFDFVNQPHNDK